MAPADDKERVFTTRSPVQRVLLCLILSIAAAYFFIYVFLGGDAVQGRISGGHFFLAAHKDGPEREVSATLFYFDVWLIRIGVCIFFVGLMTAAYERWCKMRAGET